MEADDRTMTDNQQMEESENLVQKAFQVELNRRLTELDSYGDDSLGEFTTIDLVCAGFFFIFIPLLCVWLLR